LEEGIDSGNQKIYSLEVTTTSSDRGRGIHMEVMSLVVQSAGFIHE
jgi:hypothetical protein